MRAFYRQPHDATVYVVDRLRDGSVQVRFGDGTNGARLPLGVGNVTATYRYGPSAPPPPAGALSTVLQPQPNLAAALNPLAIIGGTNPETAAETAATAPATVLLLPGLTSDAAPLISLDDSERLAATVTGVTRVRAYRTWDRELRARPSPSTSAARTTRPRRSRRSAGSSRAVRRPFRSTPRRPAASGWRSAASCGALPACSEDAVLAAATAALTGSGGLFSPRRMAIGQRLYRSQVEAALMVGGVAAVSGLRVHLSGQPDDPRESALDPGQDGYLMAARRSAVHQRGVPMSEPADGYDAYYQARLWDSLPEMYQTMDIIGDDGPGPLRELLNRIGVQAAVVRRSIDGLWADQFIETCADWVIPYIGELVAAREVTGLDPRGQRLDVANTIRWRRRKGTRADRGGGGPRHHRLGRARGGGVPPPGAHPA